MLLLVFAACTHAQREPADEFEGRGRHFVDMRAFPFAEIPAGARREALANRVTADATTSTWRPFGSPTVGVFYPFASANGRVTAVAVSPADPRIILIGGSGGGILRSTDGGLTFAPVADDQSDLSVGDIAFANANVVYAGMGDVIIGLTLGSGVLRSDDAGATWHHVSTDSRLDRGAIRHVLTDPNDPNVVWVAQTLQLGFSGSALDPAGIFESRNGGRTWALHALGNTDALVRVNPNVYVAAQYGQLVRSTDGGGHWSLALPNALGREIALAVTPLDPSLVYAAASGGPAPQLYVSHDTGATWQAINPAGLPNDSFPFGYLTVSPSDSRTLYRGIRDLYRSTDGGAHWTNLSKDFDSADNFTPQLATMHTDQHALAFGSDGAAWLGNDGGLYVSRDGLQHFSFAGPPSASLIELYGVTAHPLDASRVYGTTQDNGLEMFRSGGSWIETRTGDYGTVLFDPNNPLRFISNYTYGTLDLYDFDGRAIRTLATSATFGETNDPPRIDFIAPLVMNRTSYSVYFASWRMFVSHDFGLTWQATAGTTDLTRGSSDYVTAIAVTEQNPNVLITGSAQGRVMRSNDGGATWSNITGSLPLRAVSSIAITDDGANAWIAFSGYRSGHIYQTSNGGATWTRADTGLPDIPIDTLYRDGTTLWAGTDAGAYRLNGTVWELAGSGMPSVIVTGFTRTADGRFLASTHGRGVYELVQTESGGGRRRSVAH
ncbi:MAG TPA: hypothetical protein VJ901_17730 [Thermoanaerobaculia bacterium]|nr:hypothetical protein [Thermoanaerobaculia bacterium]